MAVAVACVSLTAPASADAAVLHPPAVGGELHGAVLERPGATAVDGTSGHVFVADPGTGYVNVYDSSGALRTQLGGGELLPIGVAVDEATGKVYVADLATDAIEVFKPQPSGTYAAIGEWTGAGLPGGGFGQIEGVAVDNSAGPSAGDVYVVDADDAATGAGVVDVFQPAGLGSPEGEEPELARVLSKGAMEEPNGVAVDPVSGRVYVADSVKGAVLEFSAAGTLEGKLTGSDSPLGSFSGKEKADGNVTAVAIDPTDGDLLVAEQEAGVVSEFDEAGQWAGWIASTSALHIGAPSGVAVTATGEVYVSDSAEPAVDVFGSGRQGADVATGKAS